MNKVLELPQGEGWSIWFKAPPHMRWLDAPIHDTWRGVDVVAVNTRTGKLYFENRCSSCGGRYLAHRADSYFCSQRCRQTYWRHKKR